MKTAPFFARFLQAQSTVRSPSAAIRTNVRVGASTTLKYPSDSDDRGLDD